MPQLLDVVALLEDLPEKGLYRGQVGTIVEQFGNDIFEVKLSDDEGQTYASPKLDGLGRRGLIQIIKT